MSSNPLNTVKKMSGKKIIVTLFVVALLMPALPSILADASVLTVATNEEFYNPGATVKITGTATVGTKVDLKLTTPSITISLTSIEVGSEGTFSYDYVLPLNSVMGKYTVTASIDTSSSKSVDFIVQKKGVAEIADAMIEIALAAQATANAKFDGLTLPSAVKNNMDQGNAALEEENKLLEENKFEAAIEAAHRAQVHFMDAIKIMFREHHEKEIEDKEHEIEGKIQRATNLINGLDEAFKNTKDDMSTDLQTKIPEELDDAKADLAEAQDYWESGDYEQAIASLESVQEHLDLVREYLKQHGHDNQGKAAINFIDKTLERIEKLKEAITNMENQLPQNKAQEVIAKLNAIEEDLKELKSQITAGNLDVKQIDEKIKNIKEALDDIGDTIWSNMLKELDELHAWMQLMKDTRNWRMKKGLSIEDIDNKIKDADSILGHYISEMAKGHKGSMSGSFSDIVHQYREIYCEGHDKEN